jgi:hypothetical protein
MTANTTYAGQSYGTAAAALEAAWMDFLTGGGNTYCTEALRYAEEGLDHNLSEAKVNGWRWPGEPDPQPRWTDPDHGEAETGPSRDDHEAALVAVTNRLREMVAQVRAEEAEEWR